MIRKNRKNNGEIAENFIADKLLAVYNNVEINRRWGVDLFVKDLEKPIKIEVKSANILVRNGKGNMRRGKFYFYPQNLERPDFYAFVIYFRFNQINESKTYFVKKEVIVEYFKNHKKETKLSLGIPTLLSKIDTITFAEMIKD